MSDNERLAAVEQRDASGWFPLYLPLTELESGRWGCRACETIYDIQPKEEGSR